MGRRTSRERPGTAGANGANGEEPTSHQTPPPAPTADVLTESLAEGGAIMSAANAAATQGPQALLTFVATQISSLREE